MYVKLSLADCSLVHSVCCLAGYTRHDFLCYLFVVTQVIRCVFRRHCFVCKGFKMTIPQHSHSGPVCYVQAIPPAEFRAFLTR